MRIVANDNADEADIRNPFDRMEDASLGDIMRHANGSLWEVVAICEHPTVVLKQIGVERVAPLDRDMLSVVPTSPWARQWRFEE